MSESKGFQIDWKIENFNFCWHKTGERLESSLFTINAFCKTSWRLWLYPRGEDDGEYISCYLFRAEGGPEVVDVDFELNLLVEGLKVIPAVSFSKIYSFKCCQKEGLKCFASRSEVSAPTAALKDRFTLTVRCNFLRVDKNTLNHAHHFISTAIATESISGIEVFDCDPSLDPKTSKDIEVKSLLEDEPLLNINLSYFEKGFVITIHPKSCGKIKYAICKISILKHWLNESPIQHARTWIGEIKTDIWKYYVPQIESVTPDVCYSSTRNSFLLHYHFAFSTGKCVRDMERPKFSVQECLDASLKEANSVGTALKALEDLYRFQSFADMSIQTHERTIPVHKAIVCARSSTLKAVIPKDSTHFELPIKNDYIADKLLLFLYSDTYDDSSWWAYNNMYNTATFFEVELLKKKCATYLKDRLSIYTVVKTLITALYEEDFHLLSFVKKYIIIHAADIFSSREWRHFSAYKPEFAKNLLLTWKKPTSFSWSSINTHF